jgi:ABC-type phosphate/phosphonate transport system substrate-binding protein
MIKKSLIFLAINVWVGMAGAAGFVFSAPPLESREQSLVLYQPIAEYLTTISGKEVVYEFPGNWPGFIKNMQQAKYDFVLDSPHFVSWRLENIDHRLLIGLAENLVYVVVVSTSKGNQSLSDLRGKSVCSGPVPNLDALTLTDQYDTSWTQPEINVVKGFEQRLAMVADGHCQAAVLPKRVYRKLADSFTPGGTKIIFESQVLPHYGLTVGPRVSQKLYEKLLPGLLSPMADPAFKELSNLYAVGRADGVERISGNLENYQGYAYLLAEFWGF